MSDTSDGTKKRPYLFEVYWHQGKPKVTVTKGDPSNKRHFHDRNMEGGAIRVLEGMHPNHRKDIHEYALRVANHLRERVLAQEAWLRAQFSDATPIEVDARPRRDPMRFAFLRGWLLVEQSFPRQWSQEVEVGAFFLGPQATPITAKDAAERFNNQSISIPHALLYGIILVESDPSGT